MSSDIFYSAGHNVQKLFGVEQSQLQTIIQYLHPYKALPTLSASTFGSLWRPSQEWPNHTHQARMWISNLPPEGEEFVFGKRVPVSSSCVNMTVDEDWMQHKRQVDGRSVDDVLHFQESHSDVWVWMNMVSGSTFSFHFQSQAFNFTSLLQIPLETDRSNKVQNTSRNMIPLSTRHDTSLRSCVDYCRRFQTLTNRQWDFLSVRQHGIYLTRLWFGV